MIFYCAQNKDIVLRGTRDSAYLARNHSYVIYQIRRCSEALGDSQCASEEEIDKWTEHK